MAKSGAERMRELRQRKKAANDKCMLVTLPVDYKRRFDKLCIQLNASISETICYLIDNATDTDEGDE